MAARTLGKNSGGTGISSLVVTITDDVDAGETILVGAGWGASDRTATVTDTGGNTYQQDATRSNSPVWERIFSARAETALTTGDHITLAWTGGTVNNGGMICAAVPDIAILTDRVDQTSSSGGTSNSLTSGSLATTVGDTIIFGFHYWQRADTLAPTSSFTEIDELNTVPGTRSVEAMYRILSATSTVAATGTATGSPVWDSIAVAYFLTSGSAPSNTVSPVVSGTAEVDQVLSCTTGTWTGSPVEYAYEWQHDYLGDSVYTAISGETTSTYTVATSDIDCHVRCIVTATNYGGATDATSNVAGPCFEALGSPVAVTAGTQLQSGFGGWSGVPTAYTYQWQQSADGTTGWTSVTDGDRSDLIVDDTLEGMYLRCRVIGVNAAGESASFTTVAGPVGAAPENPGGFDATNPELAVFVTDAAIASFLTSPAVASFASSPAAVSFASTPRLATFASSPALAAFDTPEPALT